MQADHRPPCGSRQAHLQQLQIGSKYPYGDFRTAGDRGQPPPACRTCPPRLDVAAPAPKPVSSCETPQVSCLSLSAVPKDSDTIVRLTGWTRRETPRETTGHSVAVGHERRDPMCVGKRTGAPGKGANPCAGSRGVTGPPPVIRFSCGAGVIAYGDAAHHSGPSAVSGRQRRQASALSSAGRLTACSRDGLRRCPARPSSPRVGTGLASGMHAWLPSSSFCQRRVAVVRYRTR